MTLLSLSLGSVAPEIILSFVACVVLLVDLYLQGRLALDRFVSETIGLDEVEEAFHKMERGEVLRSVVLL